MFRTLVPLVMLVAGGSLAAQKDNILIVVADDLGVDYVTVYGEGTHPAPTPNIDALAKRGVLFRNAWANPSCSPTRASLMTGRFDFRHLVGRWIRYPNNSEPIGTLRASEWTLPEILDAANSGYAHAAIGKWHINDVSEGLETPRTRGGWSYFAGTMWGQIPDYYAWPRVVNGKEATSHVYATTQQADDAIAWIKAQTKPWVCYLAFTAPHLPLHAPPAALHSQKLSGLSPSKSPRPFYRAMIEAMDAEMGRVLKSLGSAIDHTNIIFLGDNGTIQNLSEPPFVGSRAKGTPYEGGVNVPMIVAGPAVKSPGREVKSLVCAVDVFQTAVELAGATSGQPAFVTTDGVSLVPYLTDPKQASLRKFAFTEEFTGNVWPKPNLNGHATVRNDRYKLIHRYGKSHELYDLLTDPFENTNLLKRSLSAQEQQNYTDLLNEIGRLRTPGARWVPFGVGSCAGSAGRPKISATGLPIIGGSYDVRLSSAAANVPAVLLLGVSSRAWNAIPLPFDLGTLGAGPGCLLESSIDVVSPTATSSMGDASVRLAIPSVPALVDHRVFHTWLIADPKAPNNTLGLVTSTPAAAVLGL